MTEDKKPTKNTNPPVSEEEASQTDISEKETSLNELKKQTKLPKSKGPQAKSTIDILLHRKPARLLTLLLDDTKYWYTSLLARESGQSYVYATNVIKVLNARGIISFDNKGKRKILKLTEKGEKIAKALEEIIQLSPNKS